MTDEPKLGRPPECEEARTIKLALVVTPAEALALHRQRGDMPMSSWLRRIVLDYQGVQDENTRLRDALASTHNTETVVLYLSGQKLIATVKADDKTRADWDYLGELLNTHPKLLNAAKMRRALTASQPPAGGDAPRADQPA